jgi:nitroreductase/NAD-dependent dihydropyrimidine dehydrogenase PreA subunit
MPDIIVNADLCTGCGACIALCTGLVYREADGKSEAANPDGCWQCGHCVAACPVDAIRHEAYPLGACPELDPAALPPLHGLLLAFRDRRSARVFQDRPVPRGAVGALVDAGRWAPSASNGQPVDWLAFDDPVRIADLSARALARLAQAGGYEHMAVRQAQGRDPIFFRAPVVLIAHVPAAAYFGRDDAIYAAYNLMLAAQRMGLGTCQIGYFQGVLEHSQELQRAVGVPVGRRAEVTLVLGYPQYGFHRVLPRRAPDIAWNPAQ